MTKNYFDVNNALMEAEKLPVRFTTDIVQGNLIRRTCIFLESSTASRMEEGDKSDIKQRITSGTRMLAPLWLVRALLASPQGRLVYLEVPSLYTTSSTRALLLPSTVRTRTVENALSGGLTPFYYDIGMYISAMLVNAEESERIRREVFSVYQNRYNEIICAAIGKGFSRSLQCKRERDLFEGILCGQQ